ncbi:MAG: hypothetical protein RR565_02340 [Erysipelothrix sp.]
MVNIYKKPETSLNQSEVINYSQHYPLLIAGSITYLFGVYLWGQTKKPYSYTEWPDYLIIIFLIALGLGIVYTITKRNLMTKKYKNYHHIIYQEEIYDLAGIAKYTEQSEDTVFDDVQELIKKGYFNFIRINPLTNTLDGAYIKSQREKIKHGIVRCMGCGANNEVTENKISECEYCGRKLTLSEIKPKE